MQMLLMHTTDGQKDTLHLEGSFNNEKEDIILLNEQIISNHFRQVITCDTKNLSLKSYKKDTKKSVDFAISEKLKHITSIKLKYTAQQNSEKETLISNRGAQISVDDNTKCCEEQKTPIRNNKSSKLIADSEFTYIQSSETLKGEPKKIRKTFGGRCRNRTLKKRIPPEKRVQNKENTLVQTGLSICTVNNLNTAFFLKGTNCGVIDEVSNNSRKLSLSTNNLVNKLRNENYCNNFESLIYNLQRKRKTKSIADTAISNEKRFKLKTMSVYDTRIQSEERSVGNGYVSRGLQSGDDSPVLGSHFCHNSQQMIATLCNIGNTCYLNSVVYTLRFAPLFLHNLHHLVEDLSQINQKMGKRVKSSSLGRNVGCLHTESVRSWSSKDLASLESANCDIPKSQQQIATEKLHELYQNLHKNELVESSEPFHADTFLRAIQDVSTIFEGNQQQDAHEFLMCVLDSIRETCQTLIKSISEFPDLLANGLPEQAEPARPKERERETGIIKTSFFSRRSKRKEDIKQSKAFRFNSPHKENSTLTGQQVESLDSATHPNNIANSMPTDDEIMTDSKERLREKIKQLGLDFFTEDFEGVTVSTTKCLSCETVTEQKETMIDIAVPISGYENMDTSEKSHSFIQNSCITREYFRGENKYRCEQCIGYTEAIRSISYEVLPRLLVIQLSRFSGGMEKINSYLPTPFTLQCFCAKCCEQPDSKKYHVYKLYSVITHVGATMSVGHYIAYTCSLDWANDYMNCPKDRRRHVQLNSLCSPSNSSNINCNNSSVNQSSINASEKNIGLMKKMRFGRSKASSSNDISKQVKTINGATSKNITNGVEKLNISTTCPGCNCCGLRLNNQSALSNTNFYNESSSIHAANINNSHYVDVKEDANPSSIFNSANSYSHTINYGNSSNSKSSTSCQATWYMCDDDKIKAMSQREFEELLSPNRKIMVTPYLLFYARRDLQ